jgi:CNT family concentrative nucleoside transporter
MIMVGQIFFGLFGLVVLIAIGWLFSNNRWRVDWKLVVTGVTLQIAFAAFVLLTSIGQDIFGGIAHGFVRLLDFTKVGASFIFGSMADFEQMGKAVDTGMQMHDGLVADANGNMVLPSASWENSGWGKYGFVFAFQVLPTVIFFAAFMGVLYHLNVMQNIVKGLAWSITKVMRVSGAETTSVCASIFIGQTEAPLTIRPYLSRMTQSELLTVMIGGMAHIAGGVMAAYVGLLGGEDPVAREFFAKHLLTASIMAAPATLVIAKILAPEVDEPLTRGSVKMEVEKHAVNVIDAAALGAGDGLKLALNIGAMLLAFIALIAMIDAPLQWLGSHEWSNVSGNTINAWMATHINPTSSLKLSGILGIMLAPIAWVIGVPWQDATTVGGLIGTKVILNEFVAYAELSKIKSVLTEHGLLVATYALCGFANIASIAIQIGGIGSLAPDRRADLARFGLRAVLGGSLATFMTATIAGVLSRFI